MINVPAELIFGCQVSVGKILRIIFIDFSLHYLLATKLRFVIPALGHCWTDEKVVDLEPTNDSYGQKSYHCLYCDATYDEEEIPPLNR